MNWTKDREKEFIYEWAREGGNSYLFGKKESELSCYEEFNNEGNLVEYGFLNVSELNSLLRTYLGDKASDDLLQCCSVAAFKRKPRENGDQKDLRSNEIDIPDFVYAL